MVATSPASTFASFLVMTLPKRVPTFGIVPGGVEIFHNTVGHYPGRRGFWRKRARRSRRPGAGCPASPSREPAHRWFSAGFRPLRFTWQLPGLSLPVPVCISEKLSHPVYASQLEISVGQQHVDGQTQPEGVLSDDRLDASEPFAGQRDQKAENLWDSDGIAGMPRT